MRFTLILLALLALALLVESAGKNQKGKRGKVTPKKPKKILKKPPPQRPRPPQPPPPPPFKGCISQESETLNWLLKEHIEAEVRMRSNDTKKVKALNMCWLAEMAKVAFTYQGLFPGIEPFKYNYRIHVALFSRGVNPDPVQFFTSFITQYQEKILKFPPLDAGNGTFVLPFGCNWNRAEVHCVFVTENFFNFVLQLAQLGNRALKKPNEIFSSELLKLIGDLE